MAVLCKTKPDNPLASKSAGNQFRRKKNISMDTRIFMDAKKGCFGLP